MKTLILLLSLTFYVFGEADYIARPASPRPYPLPAPTDTPTPLPKPIDPNNPKPLLTGPKIALTSLHEQIQSNTNLL